MTETLCLSFSLSFKLSFPPRVSISNVGLGLGLCFQYSGVQFRIEKFGSLPSLRRDETETERERERERKREGRKKERKKKKEREKETV